jgi:hypothetical protein
MPQQDGELVDHVYKEGAMSRSRVVINDVQLADEEVTALERRYGVRVQDGAYWYDAISGAWGLQNGPTAGFMEVNLPLGGALSADASGGTSGVFINGRELHFQDVVALQRLGPVFPGRYRVDGQGNFGYEGGPIMGNLMLPAHMSGSTAAGGPWTTSSSAGTVGGDGNGFLFFQGGEQFWST